MCSVWVKTIVPLWNKVTSTCTDKTYSTDIETATSETALHNNSSSLSIASVFVSPLHLTATDAWVETHSVSNKHTCMFLFNHTQNCVFWQDIKTGDYTHAADAGSSLAPANPVSFASEKKGDRDRMVDWKTIRILISSRHCFISTSSVCVSSLTHTWLS